MKPFTAKPEGEKKNKGGDRRGQERRAPEGTLW
jgi:hypothetical protein